MHEEFVCLKKKRCQTQAHVRCRVDTTSLLSQPIRKHRVISIGLHCRVPPAPEVAPCLAPAPIETQRSALKNKPDGVSTPNGEPRSPDDGSFRFHSGTRSGRSADAGPGWCMLSSVTPAAAINTMSHRRCDSLMAERSRVRCAGEPGCCVQRQRET